MEFNFIIYDILMPEKLYFELPTDKGNMEIPENSPVNYEVEADFYKGTNKLVVLIIVGKGGTTKGYQNKYETIATNIVKRRGANVFVIENPGISRDNPELFFDSAMKFVKKKVKDYWFRKHTIYAIGFSAGGHFVGRFAYKYSNIKKILLINPVLRVDFEKLKKTLNTFGGEITIVQGNKDTDYPFNSLLTQISKAHIDVLDGVDHQFSNEGGLKTFIELPEKYLFGYVPEICPFCGEEYNANDNFCDKCCINPKHFLTGEESFPREDIESCIKENNLKSDKKCPICGEYMINIYFKSPSWTWKHLCGRAGRMDVCIHCKKGFNFKCDVMN